MLLLIVSCGKRANPDHTYLQNVFKIIDSSLTDNKKYTDADMKFLDAAFATVQHAAPGDLSDKYTHKMNYYWEKPDHDSSIIYADSSINLLKNYTEDDSLAIKYIDGLFRKGDYEMNRYNYDEAIRNYTKAKLILSAVRNDSSNLLRYYNSMANTLYAQQKYLLAAAFFRMEMNIAPYVYKRQPGYIFYEIQGNLDNLGDCFGKAGMADSAVFYFNKALVYINQNKAQADSAYPVLFANSQAVIYGNKAWVLKQEKDMKGAEKLFLKSYTYLNTLTDFQYKPYIRYLLVSLADLYLTTGETKKAREMLDELSHSINAEISSPAADYYKLLSDYYIKKKRPIAANSALLHSFSIRDSLVNRDRHFISVDISKEFENQEQKKFSENLKRDNEIKKNYLLITIISTVLVFIIILLTLYNLNRKSRFAIKLGRLNTQLIVKNDDLLKTLVSLEQSHRENNSIMRVVAHDLKNPISAIRTIIYSLLKKESVSEKKEVLAIIQSTCTDAVVLIKDLLDNKRSITDISQELVDMGRLIEQCAELLQARAGEKKQRLKLQVDDHPVLMLNRKNIMRVISNIVNHAIRFSPENTEIMIQLKRKEDSVLLSVHDNGMRIPASLKEKIFRIDPQALRAGTAGEESLGLDLSISRKIIEDHAGQLWFESEAGKGSIFYVELPYSVN